MLRHTGVSSPHSSMTIARRREHLAGVVTASVAKASHVALTVLRRRQRVHSSPRSLRRIGSNRLEGLVLQRHNLDVAKLRRRSTKCICSGAPSTVVMEAEWPNTPALCWVVEQGTRTDVVRAEELPERTRASPSIAPGSRTNKVARGPWRTSLPRSSVQLCDRAAGRSHRGRTLRERHRA